MDPQFPSAGQTQVEAFGRKHRTGLVTLVFTDLIDSVALRRRLGDQAGTTLLQAHRQLVRDLLRSATGAEEIETAGDSFLLVFARPSDAVKFALSLQQQVGALAKGREVALADRIGIHVGEVVIEEHLEGPKRKDLYGSQIDLCARVMSLAEGGQVLLTRAVFDSARQVLKGEELAGLSELRWLDHGPYVLKGIDEPVDICEVGEVGVGVLKPPAGSEKAQRQVPAGEEPVLGWRPAAGQMVPNTRWHLERKLGEGGFGEVWLGRNSTTKEPRVFKFCFQAQRVRFLKRELTLFRLLKERVGEHPNIVRLHDVYLDQPPFYVEMDYVEGHDLRTWAQERGGVAHVPLEMRLEIVAQVADALQSAHEAGVIHRDVKPSNILIAEAQQKSQPDIENPSALWSAAAERSGDAVVASASGASARSTTQGNVTKSVTPVADSSGHRTPKSVSAKLTDFGIGQVVSEDYLVGMTRAGFTQTILSDSSTSHSGTHLYMAPELLAGKPASTRSDIYSLGVVLFQLLVDDLAHPLTTDWAEKIADPLLREDLKLCFAGNPNDRFAGIAQLAKQLRALPERQAARARELKQRAALEKAAYRRGIMRTAAVAGLIIALVVGLAVSAFKQAGRARKAEAGERVERLQAERQLMHLAVEKGLLLKNEGDLTGSLLWFAKSLSFSQGDPVQDRINRLRLSSAIRSGPRLVQVLAHAAAVNSGAFSPDGSRVVTASDDHTARVWDIQSGEAITPPLRHEGGVWSAAFSPDGRRVATASWDNTARVWDAVTGQPITPTLKHSGGVVQVFFSSDGSRVVTGSDDLTARVWNATTGEPITPPIRHNGPVFSATLSADSRRVLTVGNGTDTALIWDANTGDRILALKHDAANVASAIFSPDGQRVATATTTGVQFWDASTGKETGPRLLSGTYVQGVAFSSDSRRILATTRQTAQVWDATTGSPISPVLRHEMPHWTTDRNACLSPDGRWVATASNDRRVRVWDATSGEAVSPALPHDGSDTPHLCFSPDSRLLLVSSTDHDARIWDLGAELPHVAPAAATQVINRVERNSDGHRIVLACGEAAAQAFDVTTAKPVGAAFQHDRMKDRLATVLDSRFSADGSRVATGAADGMARVWDAASGRPLTPKLRHDHGVYLVRFSPDGRRLATSDHGGGGIYLWDLASGLPVWPHITLSGTVEDVEFSPNARSLISCSTDGKAQVWNADTGKPVTPPFGHTQGAIAAKFSPDNQLVVTTSYDRSAQVWNAATGELIVGPLKHDHPVLRASFSQDGRQLFTATESGEWAWDLSLDPRPAKILEQVAQALAGRELDQTGSLIPLAPEPLNQLLQGLRLQFHRDWTLNHLPPLAAEALPPNRGGARDLGLREAERPQANALFALPFPVDLTPYYNFPLTRELSGGDLSSFPEGRHTFAGVDFDVRGLIQLWCEGLASREGLTNLPHQVTGMKIGRKCQRLHFLHAEQYHDFPRLTGSYLVHFSGGQKWEIPIVCGQDLWNWWIDPGRPLEARRSVVAWTGRNQNSPIAVYKTTWDNPFPDLDVQSIDFRSNNDWAAPFLLGLTLE